MNLRLTVELPPDIRCRLAIESAMTGKSNGAIVAELIDKHVDLARGSGAVRRRLAKDVPGPDRRGSRGRREEDVTPPPRLDFAAPRRSFDEDGRGSQVHGDPTHHPVHHALGHVRPEDLAPPIPEKRSARV